MQLEIVNTVKSTLVPDGHPFMTGVFTPNHVECNAADLTVIGNTSARYHYGINVNLNWNGIGISTFWQGVAKKNWYPRYDSGYFWGQYNRPFGYMLKAHTGSNVYSEELDNWDTA